MPRLATLLAALLLAFPASALAQGAGDDQYQDPFGDEQSQTQGGSGSGSEEGGLSDEPPVSNGGGSSGSGSGSSGSGATGSSGTGTTGAAGTGATTTAPNVPAQASGQLPNTGSDPRLLVLLGAAMVLTGVGLRLRTIDPNDF